MKKMMPDSAEIGPESRAAKAPAKRRPRSIAEMDRRTLEKLDRRSVEFQRYEAIRGALISDLGGEAAASTAQAQICDRAAFIAMQLETQQIASLAGEDIDLRAYGELVDRLRRNLESIGLERRARDITPSLEAYVAAHDAHKIKITAAGEFKSAPATQVADDSQ